MFPRLLYIRWLGTQIFRKLFGLIFTKKDCFSWSFQLKDTFIIFILHSIEHSYMLLCKRAATKAASKLCLAKPFPRRITQLFCRIDKWEFFPTQPITLPWLPGSRIIIIVRLIFARQLGRTAVVSECEFTRWAFAISNILISFFRIVLILHFKYITIDFLGYFLLILLCLFN